MTRFVLNGADHELSGTTTVAEAVAVLIAGSPDGVAVAVDGVVVRRADWAATPVPSGARLEVLTAMQGG